MEEESGSSQGPVACGSWIRRPEKVNLAVLARSRKKRGDSDSSPSVLQIFSFDPKTASLSSSPLVSLYKTPSLFEFVILFFWKQTKKKTNFVATVFINRCNCFGNDFLTDQTKNSVLLDFYLTAFFFLFWGLDHVCSWRSRWWSSFDYGAPKRWWDCVLYHKGWLQVSFFFINFHNFSYPLLCSYWFLWINSTFVNLIIGKWNKLCQFDYWTLNCSNGKFKNRIETRYKVKQWYL